MVWAPPPNQKSWLRLCVRVFSTRWSGHRTFWNNNNAKGQRYDRASLMLIHNQFWHTELMNSLPYISDCFEIIFLQVPRDQQKLDVLESIWIDKLDAEINVNKTDLPQFFIGLLFFRFIFSTIYTTVLIRYSRQTYFA